MGDRAARRALGAPIDKPGFARRFVGLAPPGWTLAVPCTGMRTRALAAPALAWLLAAPVPPQGAESQQPAIAFSVDAGTRIRKTFTRELELATHASDSLVKLGAWSDRQRVVFVDTYGVRSGQVPETLARTFEHVELEHSHDWEIPSWRGDPISGSVHRSGTGTLTGARVTFSRDRREAEVPFALHDASYAVALADEAADVAPADLRAAADSTGLLPWRGVGAGDHWFVDVDALHEICWPSGALEFVDSDGEPLVTPVDERLGQNLDGTFRVELRSFQRVGGVAYARMDLRGILESRATFPYEWSVDAGDFTWTYTGPITLDLYASLRGRLWWNLDAGHLDSIRIEGDVTVQQTFGAAHLELLGAAFAGANHNSFEWTGELVAEAVFERS